MRNLNEYDTDTQYTYSCSKIRYEKRKPYVDTFTEHCEVPFCLYLFNNLII